MNLDQLISEGEQQFDDITRSISTTVDENLGSELVAVMIVVLCVV